MVNLVIMRSRAKQIGYKLVHSEGKIFSPGCRKDRTYESRTELQLERKTTLEARTLRPDLRNFKAPFVCLNTSRFAKTNSTLLVLERGDGGKGCGWFGIGCGRLRAIRARIAGNKEERLGRRE